MRVGPTVLSVTSGIGALTRCASSEKMNCSIGENPRPPYSLGKPTPSRLWAPRARTHSRTAGPPSMPSLTAALRRHHLLQRGTDLGTQLLLLGRVVEFHYSACQPEPHRHPLHAGDHGRPH